ncbi:MAG: hypothetical protein PQJ59_14960 [Spirochaetales bacterium]|nr:hypothetical protein [Spirochaetales bacterium]
MIHKLPGEYEKVKPQYIKQGYIAAGSQKEVRLRQIDRKYFLTVKGKGNLSREEYEIPLTKKYFHQLWPSTEGHRLEKERRTISYEKHRLEIDSYRGDLSGLITGEIEFNNREEAANLTPPTCFEEELTFHSHFKNRQLARISREEIRQIASLNTPGEYPLIGTIPYTYKKEKLRVMVVTTRAKGDWIFPKGQPMTGKSSKEVALIESYEEAGIEGTITHSPIVVPYEKSNRISTMILFPLRITNISDDWQEESERRRKIMKPGEAAKKLTQPGLVSALEYLELL